MAQLKHLLRFTILAALTFALTLALAVNLPTRVQATLVQSSLGTKLANAFRPPSGTGTPVNTQGGATRGPCMKKNSKPFLAVVPAPKTGEKFWKGETVAEYPTIFWYMPEIRPDGAPAPAVEFVLNDANEQEIYSAEYPLTKSTEGVAGVPGIMSLTVSSLYPLELGREYHWQLTLMCNSQDSDRSEDTYIDGGFMRIKPDPNLTLRSQRGNLQDRVALYAENKLWYETLTALSELRRDRPTDPTLTDAWNKLLTSVGLDIIAQEPLTQGTQITNN
jgi:hypothetical protein